MLEKLSNSKVLLQVKKSSCNCNTASRLTDGVPGRAGKLDTSLELRFELRSGVWKTSKPTFSRILLKDLEIPSFKNDSGKLIIKAGESTFLNLFL